MIDHWGKELAQVLPDRPDLIVLPEVCDEPSGWPVAKRFAYYGVRQNRLRDFFAKVAKEHNCYVVYPAIRQAEADSWYNSSIVLDRNGNTTGIYNKNHVVIAEADEAGIAYGTEAPIIQCDFGDSKSVFSLAQAVAVLENHDHVAVVIGPVSD